MNVISIGYFDKHSRFYLDINRELKSKTTSSLKIYSIHFSGFLYTLCRLKNSSFISLRAWIKANLNKTYYHGIINSKKNYKGLNYNDYINFHLRLADGKSKRELQIQALAYIDIFDKIYFVNKPDCLISVGDSRLCIEIAIAMAKQKGIRVFYIEQGPFNTTFFDEEGVNANLSIRKKKTADIKSKFGNLNTNQESQKYRRSPVYRGMDIILMNLFENTKLYPPDLKFTDINTYLKKSQNKRPPIDLNKTDYVLFAMQIPLDVNLVCHSPIYTSHLEIIKDINNNLPPNLKLIIREHPLYIGKYENEVYHFVTDNNIIIDNTSSLKDILDNASIVVVNNSTVGIEAIVKNKTVVVLGNAFYDNAKICLKLQSRKDISDILKLAMQRLPDKLEIERFKQLLYKSVMLYGSITDKNLYSSKTIAKYLISNL